MQIKTRPAPADVKLSQAHSRDRNEDQQAIDAELATCVKAYTEKGGPKHPADRRPRVAFAVAPKDKAELKGMIRRACTLHKVAPVWFEDITDEATGEVVVTLTVGPQPPKKH
jgi:hypothetical protein